MVLKVFLALFHVSLLRREDSHGICTPFRKKKTAKITGTLKKILVCCALGGGAIGYFSKIVGRETRKIPW